MTSKQALREKINRFLAKSGMSPTRFGIEALGDRTFMHRLNSGSDVRMETADKITKFIDEWRPPARPKQRQPMVAAHR